MKKVGYEIIPEVRKEIVTYTCDVLGCFYETTVESSLNHHIGMLHSAKLTETIQIDHRVHTFCWFDDMKAAKDYVDTHRDWSSITRVSAHSWGGPGWYMMKEESGDTSDDPDEYSIQVAAAVVDEYQRAALKAVEKLHTLTKFITETLHLKLEE